MDRIPFSQSDRLGNPQRIGRADMVLNIASQHRTILHHILFWLQDQTYYRNRWHGQLSELMLFERSICDNLDTLRSELETVRCQFPFGYDPSEHHQARQLQSRLAILKHEVQILQDLCEAYFTRISTSK